METNRNDRKVLGLAILIVGVFVVALADWGVPLIGSSNRWAAAVIVVLGVIAGALSSPGSDSRSYTLGGLLIIAFLGAILVFATASTAALELQGGRCAAFVDGRLDGGGVGRARPWHVRAVGRRHPHVQDQRVQAELPRLVQATTERQLGGGRSVDSDDDVSHD